MRLFVSIELTTEITDQLVHIQKVVKKTELLEATFVRAENMHITLEFIGKTDPVSIPQIIDKLSAVADMHPAFPVQLGSVELDKPKHPNTLWVTVNSSELSCLAKAINSALREFREPETRDFYGHITLARIKKIKSPVRFKQMLSQIKFEKITWYATSFCLMASHLSDQAPKYTAIEKFPLTKPT